MKRKFLSWVLSLAMVLSLIPATLLTGALAADPSAGVVLGNAVYVSGSSGTSTYPNLTLSGISGNVSAVTINTTGGKATLPSSITTNSNIKIIKDTAETSVTLIFLTPKSKEDTQEFLRATTFESGVTAVEIVVDCNTTSGFNSIADTAKLTYQNGHYYLYIETKSTWIDAYNAAKQFTLGGRKGYLATTENQSEVDYLKLLTTVNCWLGGTALLYNGSTVNDAPTISKSNFTLPSWAHTSSGTQVPQATALTYYYWACGPSKGEYLNDSKYSGLVWSGTNEPNGWNAYSNTTADALWNLVQKDGTIDANESCMMIIVSHTDPAKLGLNDVPQANYNSNTSQVLGYFVEFGGYAEGADPGGRNESLCYTLTESSRTVYPAEAQIGSWQYATLKDTIAVANANNAGETVEIITAAPTATGEVALASGVTLKDYLNGGTTATTWKALDGNVKISVTAGRAVTLTGGTLAVGGDSAVKAVTVDGYALSSTAGYTVKYEDTANNTGTGQSSITLAAIGDTVTATQGGFTYTYTATQNNQTFYLGEYSASLNWDDRVSTVGFREDNTQLVKPTTPTPANPYHRTDYKVTIKAAANYSIDPADVGVLMGTGDNIAAYTPLTSGTGAGQFHATQVGTDVEVTVYGVTGNIVYQLGDKVTNPTGGGTAQREPTVERATTTITVTPGAGSSVTAAAANQYTATYTDDNGTPVTVQSDADGKVVVNRNTAVTLTFPALNGSNPNPTEQTHLTVTENESFDLLTKLTTTADTATDLKSNFQWVDGGDKSYSYTFTPTTETTNLTSTYTRAHVVHIHVSGGTLDCDTVTGHLEKKTHDAGSNSNHRFIVANNGTLGNLTFTKDAGVSTTSVFYANWVLTSSTATGQTLSSEQVYDNTDTSKNTITAGTGNYTGTTPGVTAPYYLNVSFVEGQMLTVKMKNGTVTGTDNSSSIDWGTPTTDGGYTVYTKVVDPTHTVNLTITPTSGADLKSVLANTVDVTAQVKTGKQGNSYVYQNVPVTSAMTITVDFDTVRTVTFLPGEGATDADKLGTETVINGLKLADSVYEGYTTYSALASYANGGAFFVWMDMTANKIYNGNVPITSDLTLTAQFRKTVVEGTGADAGTVIAANDFKVHVNNLASLDANGAKTLASAEAYDANGTGETVTVDSTMLSTLKGMTAAGTTTLKFTAGTKEVTVTVTVVEGQTTVTGKTAYTLTFQGATGETYRILDSTGNPVPNANVVEDPAGSGTFVVTGLSKGTDYQIANDTYGTVNATTSYVDAEDIALQFEEADESPTTSTNVNTATGANCNKNEQASNKNVKVTVGADGNYYTELLDNVDKTVDVPDNWGNVTVDLKGHKIQGDDATDTEMARPGLNFKKADGTSGVGTGTSLTIQDSSGGGKIVGGDGIDGNNAQGGAGIGTENSGNAPTNAAVTVKGTRTTIQGGKGATRDDKSGDSGGNGIAGAVAPTVDGATVVGGAGGKGTTKDDGSGGEGGQGGSGIGVTKPVEVKSGSVTGGAGGNGGTATDSNTGGNGGQGGEGISGGTNNVEIKNGSTVTGGLGGNGGTASDGTAGEGGAGGNGVSTNSNTITNAGTIAGGDGGDGGASTGTGTGGVGGQGGGGTAGHNGTLNNTGTVGGGDGGNGGSSTGGDGGAGGVGGTGSAVGTVTNTGTDASINGGNGGDGGTGGGTGNGGNGGNGGTPGTDQGRGDGGDGGNGGSSTGGDGGNGGDGGSSDNGTGGDGGNGGNSGPDRVPSSGGQGGTGGDGDGDDGNDGTSVTPTPGGGSTGPDTTPKEPDVTDPTRTGVANWLNHRSHVSFMHGFGNGLFGPREYLTRAQAAQLFYNLLLNQDVPVTVRFPDVPGDAWYAEAVNTLASLGILKGYPDGTFAPDKPITRAEFAAIATRFAVSSAAGEVSFPDVPFDAWYYDAVRTAVSYGWINGMDNGTFAPDANITRAEAATIVNRMLARSADHDYISATAGLRQFSDMSVNDWFYYQVMEAANGHAHSYDANDREVWTERK